VINLNQSLSPSTKKASAGVIGDKSPGCKKGSIDVQGRIAVSMDIFCMP
jgi:hypothetical protein